MRSWIALPGTLFWVLVITGLVTHDNRVLGAGVALAIVTFAAVGVLKLKAAGAASAERDRIVREGRRGTARVVSLGSNGGRINHHPVVDLELDVTVDGKPPYRANVRSLVSSLAIPRVQPDCEITVHVDTMDASKLVIDRQLTPDG